MRGDSETFKGSPANRYLRGLPITAANIVELREWYAELDDNQLKDEQKFYKEKRDFLERTPDLASGYQFQFVNRVVALIDEILLGRAGSVACVPTSSPDQQS